jgi:UV DNA damage endonuclease
MTTHENKQQQHKHKQHKHKQQDPTTNPRIRIGLCCLNMTLRAQKPSVFASRGITIKKAQELGLAEIQARATQNLCDLITMIEWNERHRIKVFRFSSEIFPHLSNPKLGIETPYSLEFAREKLQEIGELTKKYGHRITFHPGQFNQLGAERDCVLQSTIMDLTAHATILDMMDAPPESILILHGGGMYCKKGEDPKEAKRKALTRWVANYKELPEFVRKRVVLENCEKCYSVDDLLPICLEHNIPLVFDTHHYSCYNLLHPNDLQQPLTLEFFKDVCKTWGSKRVKMHISEQGSGHIGHHSDYISKIPDYLFEWSKFRPFDLMIEAKHKELAVFDLYRKHPELVPKVRKLVLRQ